MSLAQFPGLVGMPVLLTAAGWGVAILHVRTERQSKSQKDSA